MGETTEESVRRDVRGWLAEAWDPDLTVGEWWARLADSGWAVPTWPTASLGRDLPRELAPVVASELRAAGAIGPPPDRRRRRRLVSALQRARRGVGPGQPADPRRT